MKIEFAARTHVGQLREVNEDVVGVFASANLLVVADGYGGSQSGKPAAELTVATIGQQLSNTSLATTTEPSNNSEHLPHERVVVRAMLAANKAIIDASTSNRLLKGMGSTGLFLWACPEGIYLAHVGDSRAYRWREQILDPLTEDHTLAMEFRRTGQPLPPNYTEQILSRVIVRALGATEQVQVDVSLEQPHTGDWYLLCSDGLTSMASDDEIHDVLIAHGSSPQSACDALVNLANDNGGKDNITVAIAQILSID